jgi:hypothetical protein
MGFTTPCFIRKNTDNIRNRLKEVGYKMLSPIEYDNLECSDNWVNDIKSLNDCNGINCGFNEELFLAIAALRDDTDKNQWFTDGDKWILCPEIKFSTYWVYNDVDVNIDTVHKATVNELIEHFKTKEEQL